MNLKKINFKISIFILTFILLFSIPTTIAQNNMITPEKILKIVFENELEPIFDSISVERNHEKKQFFDFDQTISFNNSDCNNKYLYKIMDNDIELYEDYFCIKQYPSSYYSPNTGDFLIKNQTLASMPFFDKADKVDLFNKQGQLMLSISLDIYKKSNTQPIDIVKHNFDIPTTNKDNNETKVVNEPNITTPNKTIHIEEPKDINIDNIALLKISGGILLLIIVIAIYITRLYKK